MFETRENSENSKKIKSIEDKNAFSGSSFGQSFWGRDDIFQNVKLLQTFL